jgi:amino acid transporter
LLGPISGGGLLLVAFLINLSANNMIEGVASVLGFIKIGGIVRVMLADTAQVSFSTVSPDASMTGFIGATALGILAFKGFTTMTNSSSGLKDPHRNVGRAIMISFALCVVIYTLVGFSVASNLSLQEIIETKNYSLAAAARPALGEYAVWFTVVLAMLATAACGIACIFAVSQMLAMLTDMKLVPHSHSGMAGSIQKHTLVYTVILGAVDCIFLTDADCGHGDHVLSDYGYSGRLENIALSPA